MGEDALARQVEHVEAVRLRFSRETRRTDHRQPDRLETDPGEQTPDEAVALLHRADRLVDFPVHQAKVTGVAGDLVAGELGRQPVEQPRVHRADRAGATALGDHSVYVLVALFPLADHLRDELGRVLQVGGHEHDGVGVDHIEAGRQPAVHPEVAGQLQDLEPRVRLVDLEQLVHRVVGRAVFDDDRLEVVRRFGVEHDGQALGQLVDAFGFVVGGNDTCDLHVHFHTFQGGYPLFQRLFNRCDSRKVSIGCQNPWCGNAAIWWASARRSSGFSSSTVSSPSR